MGCEANVSVAPRLNTVRYHTVQAKTSVEKTPVHAHFVEGSSHSFDVLVLSVWLPLVRRTASSTTLKTKSPETEHGTRNTISWFLDNVLDNVLDNGLPTTVFEQKHRRTSWSLGKLAFGQIIRGSQENITVINSGFFEFVHVLLVEFFHVVNFSFFDVLIVSIFFVS